MPPDLSKSHDNCLLHQALSPGSAAVFFDFFITFEKIDVIALMKMMNMLRHALSLTLFCLFAGSAGAQSLKGEELAQLRKMEDSLVVSADSMFMTPIPDFRTQYCEQFVKQLIRTLKIRGSYNYPFDSLKKIVNIISPEDKSFRLFNWPIAYTDVRLRYYAAIQMNSEDLKLYPLFDNSDMLAKTDEDKILSAKEWVGGLIYNIITKRVGGENIYCLLGVNDGNPVSTKKYVDPMRFGDNGPSFGAPIFAIGSEKNPNAPINRFVLEYKKGVSVSMNWDEEHNAILFDDIASQVNDPNRKYTYVPTGQYNGLRWAGNTWRFVPNLIPILELQDGQAPDAGIK